MQIELARTVAAKPTVAFAVVAEVLGWPLIISSIKDIEILTPGPVRAGTRLRERRIMFGRDCAQELEIAEIERPHRLRLWADDPEFRYELDHVVDAIYGGGSRMMLTFRTRPESSTRRALRPLMTLFAGITLRDELEQDLSELAAAVSRQAALRHPRAGFKSSES